MDGDGEWQNELKTSCSSSGENIDLSLLCSLKINLLALTVFLLLIFLSVSPHLVEWDLENINRMQSCLIINPLPSAPRAPDHVCSYPALITPDLPFSSLEEATIFCLLVCVMSDVCAHVHREWLCLRYCCPTPGLETWLWAGFVADNYCPHFACKSYREPPPSHLHGVKSAQLGASWRTNTVFCVCLSALLTHFLWQYWLQFTCNTASRPAVKSRLLNVHVLFQPTT